MATLTMSDAEGAAGLPLQLTTITVAVPGSPLSPSSSMLSSMVVPTNNLVPVSVSQTDCNAGTVKWKYDQNKSDKVGTTLVRFEGSMPSPTINSNNSNSPINENCICIDLLWLSISSDEDIFRYLALLNHKKVSVTYQKDAIYVFKRARGVNDRLNFPIVQTNHYTSKQGPT